MTPLPTRIDRMPKPQAEDDRLLPRRVIALALNMVPRAWWKVLPLSEDSMPVRAVEKALDAAGYRIVER